MSSNTSSFPRVQKAFLRSGIQVSRDHNTISMLRLHDQVQATLLLPETFPLESKAVEQLLNFAAVHVPDHDAHVCQTCATPDFHPGSLAPVGTIVACTPDMVIPAAIGTDINCGMRLITTGLTQTQVELNKTQFIQELSHALLNNGRNIPMRPESFRALFESGPDACLDDLCQEGLWASVNKTRLHAELSNSIGLHELHAQAKYVPEFLVNNTYGLIRDPCLGTMGSGNHFVELQIVDAIMDRHIAWQQNLKVGDIVAMIHSGSRDLGFYIGRRWMDIARDHWPVGHKHPTSGLYALTDTLAETYLSAMGAAARYAWFNRVVLAEMIRDKIQQVFKLDNSRCIVDVPHNVILREAGMNIHRKGATPARAGDLALIPGSMGDYSFLATGLGNAEWLNSCSHGAGRSIRRQVTRAYKQPTHHGSLNWECITLREERRIEEAPHAYKNIGPVITTQEEEGLIQGAVRLKPWVTFKA